MSDNLCIRCAMCCNGTLFSRVRLPPADQERLGDGAPILVRKGQTYLPQPCRFLGADGACGRYEVRPDTCRTYRCKLLKKVVAGQIPPEDAMHYVDEAKRLRADAQRAMMRALKPPVLDPEARADLATLKRQLQQAEAGGLVGKSAVRNALFFFENWRRYLRLHFQDRSH